VDIVHGNIVQDIVLIPFMPYFLMLFDFMSNVA